MKKALTVLLALCLIASLTACGSSNKTDTGSSEPIVIGCLQDITGKTSSLGKMVTAGVQWAADEINANGGIDGRQVEVKVYDTTGSVDEAVTAFTTAVTVDKVSAIVGPPVANIALAIAPISENYDVPVLGFALDKSCQVKEDGTAYKNMFLFQPNSDQQAAIMATYAVKEAGVKTFGIIYNEQNSYSTSLVAGFENTVASLSGASITKKVAYTADNKDFKTLLQSLMDADAIFAPNYTADLALIAQAASELNYKGKLVCGLDACPPFNTIVENVSDLSNVIYINNVDDTEESMAKLIKEVKEKDGIDATNKFFLGYDVMNILAKTIKEVGTDSVAIRDAVENLSGYEGLTGTITINPKTHMPEGLEMVMFTYDGKTPVMLKRYSAD